MILGIGATVLVHLAATMTAAVVTVEFTPPGEVVGERGPIEVAVITDVELAGIIDAPLQDSAPAAPEADLSDALELELTGDTSLDEAVRVDASLDLSDTLGGGDLDTADGLVTGGGGGAATFFGIEATGDRFAYIVDISSSMRDGRKMDRTKAELARSIDALIETSKFLVVTYSSDEQALGARSRWSDANPRNKRWAAEKINDLVPGGSTNPAPAFERVFGLNALPDAIYFMTDGEFPGDVPERLAALNVRASRPVHCILFGEFRNLQVQSRVEGMMRQIAADSGGSFRRVVGGGG